MSIIQRIQDKYGKVMAVIIGFSLVVFVVMLAFENGGSLFNARPTTVGKINGESIEIDKFQNLVDQTSSEMEAQGMGGSGDMARQQANDQTWNQEIIRVLIDQEAEKLGITLGKRELNDLLFGSNPPQDLRQAFSDPETGQYNAAVAQQQIAQIRSRGTAEQKAGINAFLDRLAFQHLVEKYDALLSNSINFPRWMIEKQNAENALMAKVSFVREPYTSVSDSAVKVTDADIQKFIDKNKKDFKQLESRGISYVAFNAQPSAADSAAALVHMNELKAEFDSADNVKDFLVSQGVNTFYDGYISGSRIQVPMKDSIFRVGAGNIYGPYIDGNSYSLAKVVGTRSMPDTVNIRHILIGLSTQDPQSGQQIPLRDTATAKQLADSVALAIRNGANFDSMVVRFSTDPGSVNNGGVYENVPSGQMVPEFNDFIFSNPVGSRGVVKTNFGYHIIEVLEQKGSGTGYKIGYLTKPIEASNETDMAASAEATKFASQATNQKGFDAAADRLQKEKGINKAIATDISPMSFTIQGLGSSRQFIKSIYDADLGDVLQPQRVGDFYVVALVSEVNKEGTMSPAKARMMVEPLLLNEKKAEVISSKIGKITTLEAVAGALNKTVEVADSLRFNGQGSSMLGFEPKVLGAAFNKANLNKVVTEPIPGTQGVYVIRVDNQMATPVSPANVEEERNMRYHQAKQQTRFQSLQALREAATIKDYRNKFY